MDRTEARAAAATTRAGPAYWRLLVIAEITRSGQAVKVARFLAAMYDGEAFPFDPFELRGVDVAIADDMLACLDALRWGKADLHTFVAEGERRVQAVLADWGLETGHGR